MAQAINRYFNRQAAQPDFYQEPLDLLAVALDAKQKRYDAGLAASDELYNTQLDALKQDRAAADEIIQGYQGQIDKLVEGAKGDYSTLQPKLYSLKRQILKDYSPGGKAHAIATMKAQTAARIAEERKRVGKEITADQLGSMMSWFDKTYTGIGTKDPITGNYNTMEVPSIAKYTDINALVTEYAKDIVPQKIKDGTWKLDKSGKLWEKTTTGTVEITPDRIRKIVEAGLGSNQEFMSYAQQMSQFGNPISANELNNAIQRGVDTYAQLDVDIDQDIKYDDAYLIRLRQSLRDRSRDELLSRFMNVNVPVDSMPSSIINTRFAGLGITLPTNAADKSAFEKIMSTIPGLQPVIPIAGFTEKNTTKYRKEDGFGANYQKLLIDLSKAPALKSTAEDIYKEVARDSTLDGKSPSQKWEAFTKIWNTSIVGLASTSATAVKLPEEYATSVLYPVWDSESRMGQWHKVEEDGSTTLLTGKARSAVLEKPPKPATIESMGDRVGYGAADADGNKYIITGISDKLTASLTPIMKLHAPLITGEEGRTTISDGKNSYDVKTSIGRYNGETYLRMDRKDPSTGKWIQLKESDGTPVRGELELTKMQGSISSELFRNSNLSKQFLDFGDPKRMFDAGIDPIEIDE